MTPFEITISVVNTLILIVTMYYVAKSPITAVKIGRQLDNEELANDEKRTLFLTLYAYRGNPIHPNFVNGLNQIDVVFHDTQSVLIAWQKLYQSLHHKDLQNKEKVWELNIVELLSNMAVALGYPEVKQTDILKHYTPEGHQLQEQSEFDFRNAQFAYYKSGAAMNEKAFERMSQDNQQEPDKK